MYIQLLRNVLTDLQSHFKFMSFGPVDVEVNKKGHAKYRLVPT